MPSSVSRGFEEAADKITILVAILRLNTAGDIDSPGLNLTDRFTNVARVESAGKDQRR